MNLEGFLLLCISVPNIALGALILLRNTSDKSNVFFALFAFAAGLWTLGLAGFEFADSDTTALRWAQLYYLAAAIIPLAFAGFSLFFTGVVKKIKPVHIWLAMPTLLISTMILFFPELLGDQIVYRDWGKEVILNWVGYSLYTIYFVVLTLFAFIVLVRGYIGSSGLKRYYYQYLFSGFVLAFGVGMLFNLILPAFGNYQYIWVGPLSTLFYTSFVTYAIVKHRLFDIKLVIARSVAYALSIASLIITYSLLSFFVLSRFTEIDINRSSESYWLNIGLLVLVAATFPYIKHFFDRITNKIFYRDTYETSAFLDKLNQVLISEVSLNTLLVHSATTIAENLKSEFGQFAVGVSDKQEWRYAGTHHSKKLEALTTESKQAKLQELPWKVVITDQLDDRYQSLKKILQNNNVAILIQLAVHPDDKSKNTSMLALGPRKSGNPYSKQDIRLLEIITSELVIAIENSLRYEEIAKFNETLKGEVDDATKQLRRTNEKLKAMDETKDEFISMASHQLRTPLTSVKGYLSMVIEGDAGELNEQQEKLLKQAFFSSQRMVYLISDLLNVSRLRTGKFLIEPSETSLPDIIEGELDQLRETAEVRGLTLKFDRPDNFPVVMLDETKIRQVIMNFLDNAIYYSTAGGDVVVELENRPKTIELRIIDSGIGVPRSQQHQLFSKFYRAENARRARPDGTGLGLFMAKKVVIAHGGAIIFKSVEGSGSTFGFVFPRSKVEVRRTKD